MVAIGSLVHRTCGSHCVGKRILLFLDLVGWRLFVDYISSGPAISGVKLGMHVPWQILRPTKRLKNGHQSPDCSPDIWAKCGGFKYFFFSPTKYLGKWSNLTNIWNQEKKKTTLLDSNAGGDILATSVFVRNNTFGMLPLFLVAILTRETKAWPYVLDTSPWSTWILLVGSGLSPRCKMRTIFGEAESRGISPNFYKVRGNGYISQLG